MSDPSSVIRIKSKVRFTLHEILSILCQGNFKRFGAEDDQSWHELL